jgi:hypothetical protein
MQRAAPRGTVPFTLSCNNAVDTATATLPVVVTPCSRPPSPWLPAAGKHGL